MKKIILTLVMAIAFISQANSQKDSLKFSFQLGVNVGSEIFYSSDLSVLNNKPENKYVSNVYGFKLGMLAGRNNEISKREENFMAGLQANMTKTQLNEKEDILLTTVGLFVGYDVSISRSVGADFVLSIDWARYKNDFTYLGKDYDYSNNGYKISLCSDIYFSPVYNIRLGFGVEYNMYRFMDNESLIDNNVQSSLPENSLLQSIVPQISFTFVID